MYHCTWRMHGCIIILGHCCFWLFLYILNILGKNKTFLAWEIFWKCNRIETWLSLSDVARQLSHYVYQLLKSSLFIVVDHWVVDYSPTLLTISVYLLQLRRVGLLQAALLNHRGRWCKPTRISFSLVKRICEEQDCVLLACPTGPRRSSLSSVFDSGVHACSFLVI